MDKLHLRRASDEDARILFHWVNETEVRRRSLNSRPVVWEEHCRWLEGKLQDENCDLFIGLDGKGEAVGMVRFDCQGDTAVISISVDSKCRSLGYGRELIRIGSRLILNERRVNSIIAQIKPDNIASVKSFEKAGFKFNRSTIADSLEISEMILRREDGHE